MDSYDYVVVGAGSAKSIVADRLTPKKELFWYPYAPRKGRVQALAARLLGARNWRRRLNR
jgi:hypothetical protein